jgi:excisionase family DNA binding protein
MENIYLTGITLDEFKSFIHDSVKIALAELKEEEKPKDDELIKVDEVAAMLKVSKVTVFQWKKTGKIPFYRISRKVFFKRNEVLESLKKIDLMKNKMRF